MNCGAPRPQPSPLIPMARCRLPRRGCLTLTLRMTQTAPIPLTVSPTCRQTVSMTRSPAHSPTRRQTASITRSPAHSPTRNLPPTAPSQPTANPTRDLTHSLTAHRHLRLQSLPTQSRTPPLSSAPTRLAPRYEPCRRWSSCPRRGLRLDWTRQLRRGTTRSPHHRLKSLVAVSELSNPRRSCMTRAIGDSQPKQTTKHLQTSHKNQLPCMRLYLSRRQLNGYKQL